MMHWIYMCSFLLLTFGCVKISAIQLSENLKAHVKNLHMQCQKQTGVSDEVLQKLQHTIVSEDQTLYCYFHCLLDTVGLIDEENNVQLEKLSDIVPEYETIIKTLVEKCGTKHGADACETAYLTVKCYVEVDAANLNSAFGFLFI
ncbi:general odorant-binding protein 69a [Teleopsis dalmanni]|uniref:general odorant-binding protein 69a n=1 Tax=Teleopsis dalmanni TaxID=139649 RepID=UPI0018CE89D8|nr:general odorant-binding protein 69a [Teleopsis dalmanni]